MDRKQKKEEIRIKVSAMTDQEVEEYREELLRRSLVASPRQDPTRAGRRERRATARHEARIRKATLTELREIIRYEMTRAHLLLARLRIPDGPAAS